VFGTRRFKKAAGLFDLGQKDVAVMAASPLYYLFAKI
jgi:hypothetical protein